MLFRKKVQPNQVKARHVKRNPRTLQIIDAAYAFQKRGNLNQAAVLFHQVLQAEPGNPFALYALGVIALRSDDSKEAVRLLEQALENGYLDNTVYTHLGLAYLSLGRVEDAIRIYSIGIEKDPKNPHYPSNLAVIYAREEMFAEALGFAEKALAADPNFLPALVNAGGIFLSTDQTDKAEQTYQRILELEPGNLTALQGLETIRKAQSTA
jgi:tetratricopeptide (TPR) repeat protein